MAFNRTIESAQIRGGMIKHIEMSPTEALEFIDEMHECREQEDFVKRITVDRGNHESIDFRLLFFRSTPIKSEHKEKLVAGWKKNAYNILYDDIPLKVVEDQESPPTSNGDEWIKDSQLTK